MVVKLILHKGWNTNRLLFKNPKFRMCNTVILPVILYDCETYSLHKRVEHKLRMSENRVLRRILWLKRDEVTGGWRMLLNVELHNLYPSASIIRMVWSRRKRLAGHVAK
jgi:hypothetical protein